MKKLFFKVFFTIFVVNFSIAQTSENPWSFSVGSNITYLLEINEKDLNAYSYEYFVPK